MSNLNMNSIMKTIGGIVTIVIAFILFPIILDSTATILADANIANYTGLSSLVKVAPLLIFVGMLFGGGMLSWTGARSIRKG